MLEELSRLYNAGTINESTYVWRDVEPALDWLPLNDHAHATLLTMLCATPQAAPSALTDAPPSLVSRKSGSYNNVWSKDSSGGGGWKTGNPVEVGEGQARAGYATGNSAPAGQLLRQPEKSPFVKSGEDRFRIDVRTGEQVFTEQGTNRTYRLGEGGAKLYDDLKPKKTWGGSSTWQTSQVQADVTKGAVNRPGRI